MEWVSLRKAPHLVAEPMLKDIILSFEQRLLATINPPRAVTQ